MQLKRQNYRSTWKYKQILFLDPVALMVHKPIFYTDILCLERFIYLEQ